MAVASETDSHEFCFVFFFFFAGLVDFFFCFAPDLVIADSFFPDGLIGTCFH